MVSSFRESLKQRVKARVEVMTLLKITFDGDALNGMLILDNDFAEKMERFAPHLSVLDLRKPRTISKAVTIPAPAVVTMSNWLAEGQ